MLVLFEKLNPPAYTSEHDPSAVDQETRPFLRHQATKLWQHEPVWHPPADLYEADDCYYVKVELGGMMREDIQVTVEDGVLAFRGRRSDTSSVNKIRYRQAEIKYGLFEVCLRLPDDVDINCIRAAYCNGFLEAALPKLPNQSIKTTRVTIEIG